MLVEGLEAQVVDIDNAFLNGNLDHEIYMKIPEGYQEVVGPVEKGDSLALDKAIYGLVQAARQYWKLMIDVLEQGGFKKSESDPCLVYKEDENGVCIIIIYINDMLIVGSKVAVQSAITHLKQHFQVKDPTTLADYLGVEVKKSSDGKRAWLGQPTILQTLAQNFQEEVLKMRSTLTPGTPSFTGQKIVDEGAKITEEEQSRYRSGVGILLYLTKHSRPDIQNPVRELSKSMDGASKLQYRELLRVIKFVLDTQEL